jgi:hypothetical protein
LDHSFRDFSAWSHDPVALACGEAKNHGEERMAEQSCSLHGSQEVKSEREEETRVPNGLTSFQQASPPKVPSPSNSTISWELSL